MLRLACRIHYRIVAWLLGFGVLAVAHAMQPVDIQGMRMASTGERTRLVFDISGPVQHSVFTLQRPDRVVIDISDATLREALTRPTKDKAKLLHGVRHAARNNDDLRIVLDVNDAVRAQSFLLRPDGQAGHRLVIDLYSESNKSVRAVDSNSVLREIVIAIDAGHGGKDPGAIGRSGTYEKHVVLAIAKELARQVQREPGMQPVLIRDSDHFMGLRERIAKAREHKADLFISIHADGFRDKSAHGSSVYALSLSGASSEAAQWLANRENAAELIGGVSLRDKDDLVASVLLDLSQTAAIQSSLEIGNDILQQLGKHNRLHKTTVQQAGFMVLKSPDIPSVLIETAFISNPAEERKLSSRQHQKQLASAILQGVRQYYRRNAPPGTFLAEHNRKLANNAVVLETAGDR